MQGSVGERVAGAYRRHLFGNATLQDLPASPRFIFCATNLGSGALVRFERRRLAVWRVGRIARPTSSWRLRSPARRRSRRCYRPTG
jgi:NTE family protein